MAYEVRLVFVHLIWNDVRSVQRHNQDFISFLPTQFPLGAIFRRNFGPLIKSSCITYIAQIKGTQDISFRQRQTNHATKKRKYDEKGCVTV